MCRPRYEGGLPRLPAGGVDYKEDFFGKPAYLTVSGQLQVRDTQSAMISVPGAACHANANPSSHSLGSRR